jgi:hypothetical protein
MCEAAIVSSEKNATCNSKPLDQEKPYYIRLIEKQIDYAAALQTTLVDSKEFCEKLNKKFLEEFQVNASETETFDTFSDDLITPNHPTGQLKSYNKEYYTQRIAELQLGIFQLRKNLIDTRVQSNQLQEVYKQQYPDLHKISLANLLTCLSKLKNVTDELQIEPLWENL